MKNKSTWIILGIVAVLLIWGWSGQNSLVKSEETVNSAWAQVENVYQRRADLIPNLVATVKGYAQHESSTLEAVTQARASATQMKIDPSNMTASQLQQFQANQGELSSALGRLMVVIEKYPELKANENFMGLQAQLEGTENRITVERNRFNEAARTYNTKVRVFPRNILASIFGFETKPYFESEAGANVAPKVEF